ncbi:MAG: response regulator receiver protein [Bacteroidota bacterium]
MKKVLVTGVDQLITNVIVRLLNQMDGFSGVTVNSASEMAESLRASNYDILLIGAGFDQAQEQSMTNEALEICPNIKILEHYGGGSGLLKTELEELTKCTKQH